MPQTFMILTLADLSAQVQTLEPPFAYRLSLDSGVEFNNVRQALREPLSVRLSTIARLLTSFGVALVVAHDEADIGSDDPHVPRVVLVGARGVALAPSRAMTLKACRQQAGMSMAVLAERAKISVDTVTAIERGQGLMRNVDRMAHEIGLRLFVVLPPQHASLTALWAVRADTYLVAPAQYPAERPSRMKGATESSS